MSPKAKVRDVGAALCGQGILQPPDREQKTPKVRLYGEQGGEAQGRSD